MITILVCTAAGLLCAAMGWFAGRAGLLLKLSKRLIVERGRGYDQGYLDGCRAVRIHVATIPAEDDPANE